MSDLDNKNNGEVSVIIPVYNVEEYILECLKSLEKQTFKNFEIILVDDGTTDSSIQIAEDYLSESIMSYKIIHQKNKGLPAARNTGIKNAKGKYICYLDSDDIFETHHLELLHSALENYDIDFSFSSFEMTTVDNRYGKRFCPAKINILSSNEIRKMFLNRSIPIHCCSIMIKRTYLLENNLFFNEKLKYGEDVEYLWRLLSKIQWCAYFDSKSYKYLKRPNSLMTNQNIERIEIFILQFKKTMQELDFEESFKEKVLARVYFGICHSCAKNSTFLLFKEMIDKTNIIIQMKGIEKINDYRVFIMYQMLKIFPRIFWAVSKFV